MSTVSLDGVGFAALAPGAEVAPVVHAALDAQVNCFCAHPYGYGDGFDLMARALSGQRERVVLGAAAVVERDLWSVADPWRPERLRLRLETALRRLRTDSLDLWLLEGPPDHAVADDDLWAALLADRQAGWIAAVGVATSDEAVARAALGVDAVDALAMPFPVTRPEPGRSLAAAAEATGRAFLARSVEAESAGGPTLAGTVAGLAWPDADRSAASAAVAGVLSAAGVTSALVTPSNPDEAADLAQAMVVPLDHGEEVSLHGRWEEISATR